MRKIYTPRHPLILENYIMYGIVSALSRGLKPDKQYRIKVTPKGEFYEISYPEELRIDCSSIYNDVVRAHDELIEIEKFPRRIGLLGSLGFQNEENIFKFISETTEVENINGIYSGESLELSERGSPCELHGKHVKTAQIPLAPTLGKYYSKHISDDVSLPKPRQYSICSLCLLLALEGLLKYSTIFLIRGERYTAWIFSQLKPNTTCTADNLNYLIVQNQLSKRAIARKNYMNEVPEIVVPLLVFYIADSHVAMELSKLTPELISYKLEGVGKAPAIRSYNTYNITSLLEFISTVKGVKPEFEYTIDALRRHVDKCVDALTFLSLSILAGNIDNFYDFLRLCSAYYGQGINIRIPNEEEIRAAIQWFYRG
ncbi:MAG: hypothetical protein QXP91_11190 [Candidatus Methanomethylicia archaeon]